MEKIFIYTLSDSIGVRYIGKTKHPEKRQYRHIFDANQIGIKNKRCAWIKSLLNKGEKPIFDIIDEANEDNWIFLERYWISQFITWGFDLVNGTDGGDGTFGRIVSNETKIKMSLSKKGKTPKNLKDIQKNSIKEPVLQYDLDGNFIKEYESSNYVKLNLKIKNISSVLNNKRCSSGGFIWKYKSNPLTNEELTIIKTNINKTSKKQINQYDKNGNLIKEWDSISDIKKIYSHIGSVLYGNRKSVGGFIWKFK